MSEKRAYVSEADYARRMKETVLPYLNARRYDGYFAGYDGNLLHYVKYAAAAATAGRKRRKKRRLFRMGLRNRRKSGANLPIIFCKRV